MLDTGKLRKSKKILFVHQFLAMGDAILLSPVYKTIKDNIKGVDISVLTNRYSVPFISAIPYVDHVYSLEAFLAEGLSRLEKIRRLCIFFVKNRFDTIVLRGDKRLPQRALTLTSKICFLKTVLLGPYLEEEVEKSRHIVETYFRILERMGLKAAERGRLYLNLTNSALSEAKAVLKGKTGRLAGIAPVSNVKVKNWSPEKTAELILRLKERSYDIVFFCADKEFSERMRSLPGMNALMVVERIDFSLLIGIISACTVFIGVDTGPTHVAAAFGVPTVGLYGPTSGTVAGPYGERCTYIQSKIQCPDYNPLALFSPKEKPQGCYREGRCTLFMTNCMDGITAEEVIEAIDTIVLTLDRKHER